MGSQIRCVVLMGLWLIGSGAAAQEVDLAPLPLCGPTEYFELQASIAPAVQSQDVGGPVISKEKPPRPERQQGTSNDRVLRTMPNFLKVGSADEIPPLSLGRNSGLPCGTSSTSFVLPGFVGGLGQASNSHPTYGQGLEGYGKRYGTAYADNLASRSALLSTRQRRFLSALLACGRPRADYALGLRQSATQHF